LIWIVNVKEQYQNDLNGNPSELVEVEIEVQAGLWTRNFLNREGEKQNKALYQYGFINQDILSIDPYKKELSAALALYLIQNRRSHPSGKYRVQTLLEAVMSVQEIEAISRDRLKRSRFLKRFYSLLEELTEINFSIKFDNSFPKELLPGWAVLPEETTSNKVNPLPETPQENRMPDGFFDSWLQGVVIIIPPAPIEAELTPFEIHKAELAKRAAKSTGSKMPNAGLEEKSSHLEVVEVQSQQVVELTGILVKQFRQAIGMSQMEVANAIGRSQSWIRDVENKWKDKPLKPAYADKLQKILGLS
jgi:DNA-binding transcriptional regulator YiaG